MSDRPNDAVPSTSARRLQSSQVAFVLLPLAIGLLPAASSERAVAQAAAPPAASTVATAPPPPPGTHAASQPVPPAPPPPVDEWTPAEIAAGIAQCQKLLAKSDVVATPVPPFKSGDCGSPAAVELSSIGRNPAIKLEPAVVVTCELAATLASWAAAELQPLALRHLGQPVTRIDTMSSYSCRNAYGRKKSRLSEHGRANAIDIRAFAIRGSDEVSVLADWGPSERKMAAMIAAAKAAEAKRVQALAAAGKAAPGPSAPPHVAPSHVASSHSASAPAPQSQPTTTATIPQPAGKMALSATPRSPTEAAPEAGTVALPRLRTIIEGLPGLGQRVPGLRRPGDNMGLGQPSYLGGAKDKVANVPTGPTKATPPSPAHAGRQAFIRAVHVSACRTFGTVLGPEANVAHENHFHFDMAERNNGNYCE